jgi:hypothetical protein
MSLPRIALSTVLLLSLVACGSDQPPVPTAAERAEQMANAGLQRVDIARGEGRHQAAFIYAEEILKRYPDSAAAGRLRGEIDALREAADAEREERRLAEMWTYHAVEEDAGTVYTAYIYGQPVAGPSPEVRLVLRRHPEWGQNSYLLIGDDADFACQGECRAQLAFDGADAEPFVISRAKGVKPPAVFLEEDQRVLDRIDAARELELRVDLRGGRPTGYRFELAGFDPARLGPSALTDASAQVQAGTQ